MGHQLPTNNMDMGNTYTTLGDSGHFKFSGKEMGSNRPPGNEKEPFLSLNPNAEIDNQRGAVEH